MPTDVTILVDVQLAVTVVVSGGGKTVTVLAFSPLTVTVAVTEG